MVLVDINSEERGIILKYLVAYLGLHGDEFSDDEEKKEKFMAVIHKFEAIPI
jgi:hypothetical protein